MRLTLRTLLAYLDDVLEPDDADQIARKISESEFASELRYRALSSSRKLQLSSPPLDAVGTGHDANTVADYLDNTLSLDQVPEFERVCLESDTSLAEVVSCHRIMMMVLGEPAQIRPELRQHLNGLIDSAGKTSGESVVEPEETVSAPVTLAEQRLAREKPDYVAAGTRSGLGRLAVASILVILIGLVGLRLAGPFNAEHSILGGFFSSPEDLVDLVDQVDQGDGESQLDPSPLETAGQSSQLPNPDLDQPIARNDNLLAMNQLGNEYLLRRTGSESSWQPVGVDEQLVPGDQLLSLPLFHPRISLSNGIQVTLDGYCQVALHPASTTSGTIMAVDHGQLSLYNVGSRESTIDLELAGIAGIAQLPSPGARILIEVSHYIPPGGNPLEMEPVSVVRLICIGSANWETPSLTQPAGIAVEAGYLTYTMVADQEAVRGRVGTLPVWVTRQGTEKPLEREAASGLLENMDLEQPIETLLLKQLEGHNRVEVRALAAECLAVLGQYDSVLQCWNDAEYRSHWERQVQLVCKLATSGTDVSREIQQSLSRQREQRSDVLYRLLLGYSPEQLEGEAGVTLVEQLNDSDMDVRLLAHLNLKWITGFSKEYRAHKSPDQQSPQIQGWRQLLKEGLVRYEEAPGPQMVLSPLLP